MNETEKLFARANAAIAEATRLAEESLDWRRTVGKGVRLMHIRARFYPKTLKFYSPLDFLFRVEPRPNGASSGIEQGDPISDPRADSSG